MSPQGIDLTAQETQELTPMCWHDPHPIFVILLIGQYEIPFGIQKDFLWTQSAFFQQLFSGAVDDKVEHVFKFPDVDPDTFGCFQNFLYTGEVYDKRGDRPVPDYTVLMGVWKLATKWQMSHLRLAVLETMAERRRQTGFIPSVEIMVEAWKQTEEGSGLRKMFSEWAADHMRSHPSERDSFSKSLPKEILRALAIVLCDFSTTTTTGSIPYTSQSSKRPISRITERKEETGAQPPSRRSRKSTNDIVTITNGFLEGKPIAKKPTRKSEPVRSVANRSPAAALTMKNHNFTPEKEMEYCRDLIKRMLSGPGYWTRYVPNFRNPVEPEADDAPNYFDVVKKPMSLSVVKTKMDNNEYVTGAEFEADIRLIFQNCYEYWTPEDLIWSECEAFEEFFNSQWAQRIKYTGRRVKAEPTV